MRKSDRYSQQATARLELLPDPRYGNDYAEEGDDGSFHDAEASASASTEFYRPARISSPRNDENDAPQTYSQRVDRAPRMAAMENGEDDETYLRSSRRVAVRRGRLPESIQGRIAFGLTTLVAIGIVAAIGFGIANYLLHDEHFRLASHDAVQAAGNEHVSRAQVMDVFSQDAGRNVFTIPLSDRRAALESLPWVEHATVMRLLPNRLRVTITERKPVASTREGGSFGLVDASGALMPMPQGGLPVTASLPIVIGITQDLPLSTRAARMAIYDRFIEEIDSAGPALSHKLSEVDLSDPEDIRALVPEDGMDVLVHFGDTDYLNRFHNFEEHLPEWREMYPHLASADMRYDHQVVLDMEAGTSAPANAAKLPPPAPVAEVAKVTPPVPVAQKVAAPAPVAAQAKVAAQPKVVAQAPPPQRVAPAAQPQKANLVPALPPANKNGKHSAAIPLVTTPAANTVAKTQSVAPAAPQQNAASHAVSKAAATQKPSAARQQPATAQPVVAQKTAPMQKTAQKPTPSAARPFVAQNTTARAAGRPTHAAVNTSAAKRSAANAKQVSKNAKTAAAKKPAPRDDGAFVLPSISSNSGRPAPHKFVPAPVTGGAQ